MKKKAFWFICSTFLLIQAFGQKPELIINTFHSERVYDMAFHPSGEIIATGSWDKTIIIWDYLTGRKLRTLNGHNNAIFSLSFSADGKYLASGGGEYDEDNTIRIWDPLNGKLIKEIPSKSKDGIRLVQFTQTNNQLVSYNGSMLHLIDIQSGKILKSLELYSSIYSINDSGHLLVENNKNLEIYDLLNLQKINEIPVKNSLYELVLSFSSKNNVALIEELSSFTNGNNYNYLLRNMATGADIKIENGEKKSWAISSDGSKLVLYKKGGLYKFYDLVSGALVKSGKFKEETEHGIFFSPDLNTAFIISNTNALIRFNFETNDEVFRINGPKGYISSLDLSTKGDHLACGFHNGTISVWNLINNKNFITFKNHSGSISGIDFSDDGKFLAAASFDQKSTIVELSTGVLVQTLSGHTNMLSCVKFSPDGQKVLTAGWDNLICEWNLSSGLIKNKIEGNNASIASADYCGDINTVVSASKDGKIILWDKSTGKQKDAISKSKYFINSLQLSRDKTIAACINGNNNDVDLFSCNNKLKQMATIKFPNSKSPVNYVKAVCLSPDNKLVAFSGKNGELHIADIATGKITQSLNCGSSAQSLLFSDDGKYLISCCIDNSILFWDTKSWNKITTIFSVSPTDWVVVTPDGRFDGTEEGIKMVHFVKGNKVVPLEGYFEEFYTPGLLSMVIGGAMEEKFLPAKEELDFPPSVEIISTEKKENEGSLSVTVQAIDRGDGVDEIKLFHNGKLVNTTQRGFKQSGSTVKFDVLLTAGVNRIKAVAHSKKRTESSSKELIINHQGTQSQKPDIYILAIGINNYLNPKYCLNFAKNDAEAFAQSLKAGAESLFGSVSLTSLSDANATRARIIAALDKIKSTTKPEDVFVFYYAGHGVMSTGSESEKSLFYLVPYDVTKMYEADEMLRKSGISATEIGEFSKNIKAQKQLFVIDACQSGGAIQTLAMRGAAEEKAIAQLARSTGTYFIAASGTEQFASEVAELGHGIFTYSVIEALKGSCKSQDGKVTVNLLKSCVEDLVPELSKKHKGQPQFPTGYGFGQDFPIVIVK